MFLWPYSTDSWHKMSSPKLILKNVLPTLTSAQQTAFVKKKIIRQSGRLISDIIEVTDGLNIEGFLNYGHRKSFWPYRPWFS